MYRADLRVAVGAAAAFVLLAVMVAAGWSPLVRLDTAVAHDMNAVAAAHPGLVKAMKILTNAAGPLVWRVVVVALGAVLLLRRQPRLAAFAFLVITVGGLLSTAVKVIVDRTRPVVPHPYANAAGMSFPSGHAATSVLACGVVLLLALPVLHGWWRALAWVLAVIVPVAVGYTRIGLDVHWVSDIVGGWLLGIAVVAAVHAAVRPAQALGSLPVSR